jgi:hypothetical protein
MSVVISSTTSSQAQLDHAASDDWRTPPAVEAPEPAPAPEPEEPGGTAAATEPAEETESRKKKGGFQKKIDRLVSRASALENELEAERRANADLRARLEKPSETVAQPVKAEGKPSRVSFKTDEEYIEALTDWKIAQREAANAQQAEAAERGEVVAAYNHRVAELRAEHDDFDEVVGQDIQIPLGAIEAIYRLGDEGPEVSYFLGKNPEVCDDLRDMHWMDAVRAVGEIAASLRKEHAKESSPESTTRRTPPPPVRAVGGTSARSSIALDQLSGAEYVKLRNQEARAKGRRF